MEVLRKGVGEILVFSFDAGLWGYKKGDMKTEIERVEAMSA